MSNSQDCVNFCDVITNTIRCERLWYGEPLFEFVFLLEKDTPAGGASIRYSYDEELQITRLTGFQFQ